MTNKISILKSLFKDDIVRKELLHHSKKSDDIYAMTVLEPLITGLPYLPFNGGALRPICIAYILNEIIINQRKMILEFGSGLSTIMMARLLKRNQLDAKIITVEHNQSWVLIIKDYLEKESLLEYVNFLRTDLKDIETPLGVVKWYDFETVSSALKNKKIDLLIIDGPPANETEIMYSRNPALFKLQNIFADDFCILLDDANRKGEQDIIRLFKKNHLKLKYQIISETLAVIRNTDNFNPIPIHY